MALGIKKDRPRYIGWLLDRIPAAVPGSSVKLLAVVALALLLEEYDLAMLMAALKQIAAELGMEQRNFGLYLAIIRLGAVPAFILVALADRLGRRRIFLFSIMAMAVSTALTAFAQTPAQFVALQALVRTFFVAGSAVSFVIISEEFPAEHRGWGMGFLAAAGAMGHGLGVALFSQINRLPYGWRALYAMGLLPLLLLPLFRKYVMETKRFSALRDSRALREGAGSQGVLCFLEPLRALACTRPGRAFGMVCSGYLSALAWLPAFQFSGYFVQTKYGWPPQKYALMVIVAGAVGIIANIVAGRMADRFGRKPLGMAFLLFFPACTALFYHGPVGWLAVAWACLVLTSMGGRLILRAFSTELFPTAHRSAAAGSYTVLEILGAASGLLVIYFYGTENLVELTKVIPMVSLATVPCACILLLFPETGRRTLEDISGPAAI